MRQTHFPIGKGELGPLRPPGKNQKPGHGRIVQERKGPVAEYLDLLFALTLKFKYSEKGKPFFPSVAII